MGEGHYSVLRGFTITNGDGGSEGGGIYCKDSSPTLLENVICNLEGYHIRSDATFSPYFADVTGVPVGPGLTPTTTASSAGLNEISKVDIRQNGIKGRLSWQIDDDWSCSVEAAYDDYNDKNSNAYDGTVVSTMASLSRTW